MNNWDNFKCRCSGIHKIMANKQGFAPISEVGLKRIAELEGRSKPMTEAMQAEYIVLCDKRDRKEIVLGDTCIAYLMEVYAWETEGMISVSKESLDNLSMKKGKLGEPAALMLLSFVEDVSYEVHKERISNEYLTGQIDSYLGRSVYAAKNVTDIKISWDYPIFLCKLNTGLTAGQKEQLQGYGDITGAGDLYVANCLVSAPQEILDEYQWKVLKKIGAATTESTEFKEEWPTWERSLTFERIPARKRVSKIKIEPFSQFERQAIYDRVKYCRDWLSDFDEKMQKMNLPKENLVPLQ